MAYLLPLRTKFRKEEWHVAPVQIGVASSLVQKYHYAGTGSVVAVYSLGLFLKGYSECFGVSWWLPAPKLSVDKFNPRGWRQTLILHRLVVHPAVPTNGASFLIGKSVQIIERGGKYNFLLTYADTEQGHTGAIYKATNWQYEGLGEPSAVWVDKRGVRVSVYCCGRSLSNTELKARGYIKVGEYPKHIYSMRLSSKVKQLPMFADVA